MKTIKEYRDAQLEEHYKFVKELILYDIKQKISEDPFIDAITYRRDYSFLVPAKLRRNFGLEFACPYKLIEKYYKTLCKELVEEENIILRKIVSYKTKKKSFFSSTIIEEWDYDYYVLKWNW